MFASGVTKTKYKNMKKLNANNLKLRDFEAALLELCTKYQVKLGAVNAELDVFDLESDDYNTVWFIEGTDYTNYN